MFQPSDSSRDNNPSNAFRANQFPNHSLSALLLKLFFGGLLVDVISLLGLFVVGALSVTFRISSYNSFLLGLIPIMLDCLVVAGTVILVGRLFFGRSGPLDNKRWSRYLMGQLPGFLLTGILLFAVSIWLVDRRESFNNTSVFLILVGAAVGGFGLGMFSILTHNAKDAASIRQAEAVSSAPLRKSASPIDPTVSVEDIPAKRVDLSFNTGADPSISPIYSAANKREEPIVSAGADLKPSPRVVKLKIWQVFLLSLLAIGAVFAIYWMRKMDDGSISTPVTDPQSASAGEQGEDHPIKPPAGCRLWREIGVSDAGRKVCAYGVVKAAYLGGEITYIVFTEDTNTFRLINLEGKDYSKMVGRCVFAEGEVKTFGEIAYIEVEEKLSLCE
ncbi:MAG: hypothetical protein HPY59_13300 [Anaerolineae bacterium]|nr:hypothetical protein [Anaerolineae bacterium]